jgi:hypothetical protein
MASCSTMPSVPSSSRSSRRCSASAGSRVYRRRSAGYLRSSPQSSWQSRCSPAAALAGSRCRDDPMNEARIWRSVGARARAVTSGAAATGRCSIPSSVHTVRASSTYSRPPGASTGELEHRRSAPLVRDVCAETRRTPSHISGRRRHAHSRSRASAGCFSTTCERRRWAFGIWPLKSGSMDSDSPA